MTDPLLSVDDLSTDIHTREGTVSAVDGLSFTVEHGETVCLVGESGSGKTLACDSITGLVGPPADISGSVRFDGTPLLDASEKTLRRLRGNELAYVFQNAHNALDPVYTIGEQISEAIQFHEDVSDTTARERAIDLLREVGLSRVGERVDQYPHELSDGMCQRVALAVGLASDPSLLLADEPTSALDVVIQRRIIDQLATLRETRDLAILLVTHNLRVVSALADRIVVLYAGQPVEYGPASAVLDQPAHPYTQALFRSFTGDATREVTSRQELPETGCPFVPDCPHAVEDCSDRRPLFNPVDGDERHQAACIFFEPDRDSSSVLADSVSMRTGDRFGDTEPEVSDTETDVPEILQTARERESPDDDTGDGESHQRGEVDD
jgi:peptide/nickel transport system ATP-binding protein